MKKYDFSNFTPTLDIKAYLEKHGRPNYERIPGTNIPLTPRVNPLPVSTSELFDSPIPTIN